MNALAVAAPEWLKGRATEEWFARYARPVDEHDLPKGISARKDYAELIGRDGMRLLSWIAAEDAPRSGWGRCPPWGC
jgi:transposase